MEPKFDDADDKITHLFSIEDKIIKKEMIIEPLFEQYYELISRKNLDSGERALFNDLEEEIIKEKIDLNSLYDQQLENDKYRVAGNQIKKFINQHDYPLNELSDIDFKNIFNNLVIINKESYCFVINLSNHRLSKEDYKHIIFTLPLLSGLVKIDSKSSKYVQWKIILH